MLYSDRDTRILYEAQYVDNGEGVLLRLFANDDTAPLPIQYISAKEFEERFEEYSGDSEPLYQFMRGQSE